MSDRATSDRAASPRLFRCVNPACAPKPGEPAWRRGQSGFEFEADGPRCPKCHADGNHPRLAHFIFPLTLVHFDPPSEYPGVGLNVRACDPDKAIQVSSEKDTTHAGTGAPEAVTCPACRASDVFKRVTTAE